MKVRRRDTLLATLIALLLAPFVRLADLFKPKKKPLELTGTDDYFVFGPTEPKVLQFDSQEPFSVSCWFKQSDSKPALSKKDPLKDKGYMFNLGPTQRISDTTLLEDISDDEWHYISFTYDGGDREPEIFINGRRPGEPEPEGIEYWGFKDDDDTPPALS